LARRNGTRAAWTQQTEFYQKLKKIANLRRMNLSYRWRSAPPVEQLERDLDALRTENIRLRREAANKDLYIGRLKVLCHERTARIDDQRGRIEQLQERNRCLDEEAERLAEMVKLSQT
jgi:hypothetical protein